MDFDEYFAERLIKERLAEAEAAAARSARLGSLPPRQPARVALGCALIRLGHWLAGQGLRYVEPARLDAEG